MSEIKRKPGRPSNKPRPDEGKPKVRHIPRSKVSKMRECLRCEKEFFSYGPQNRMCTTCAGNTEVL